MQAKKTKLGEFTVATARDISNLREAAAQAGHELRALQEIEMGWVAGGDGVPVWPY
jgi:hypothetical protein